MDLGHDLTRKTKTNRPIKFSDIKFVSLATYIAFNDHFYERHNESK